jgi:hypothetical protein
VEFKITIFSYRHYFVHPANSWHSPMNSDSLIIVSNDSSKCYNQYLKKSFAWNFSIQVIWIDWCRELLFSIYFTSLCEFSFEGVNMQ